MKTVQPANNLRARIPGTAVELALIYVIALRWDNIQTDDIIHLPSPNVHL